MTRLRAFGGGLAFVAVGLAHAASASAADLPVPCATGTCGALGPQTWVSAGRAFSTSTQGTLTIDQKTDRVILNWASFDVGPDGRVVFKQPSNTSIALNRIFQGSPSKIFGAVEANGEIYLVNQNGFIFGRTARVNAAGVLASTLDISDSVFQSGLLAPQILANGQAALASDGRIGVLDKEGNPVLDANGEPLKVKLVVESGAELSTKGTGGRVLLASQTVENGGSISANGGQVVLAAGEKVFLQASEDLGLRGLLVEVDAGGTAWNQATGNIQAARGNITVVGLAVNQDGRMSATTTVAENGSVRLLARDGTQVVQTVDGPKLQPTRGGKVELGANSVIDISPDLTSKDTAVDEQAQLASRVEIEGTQVMLRSGAQINAAGGQLRVATFRDPANPTGYDPAARIRVESGVTIDLSGSDATVPVGRNIMAVELRGNELRDSPNQRDGALRGKTVYVDARVGTPLGDVSGAIAATPRDVAERTSAGGSVAFDSAGDIVVADGATIDVSGGQINYEGGPIQTTQLILADGSVVDIGQADPNRTYVGLINPTVRRKYDTWGVIEVIPTPGIARFEPSYVDGRSAGSIQFAAPQMVLNGQLKGSALAGPLQRDPAKAPRGGQLIIGSPTGQGLPQADYQAPSVQLVEQAPLVAVGDDQPLQGQGTLLLPVEYLQSGGFSSTAIYSNGVVTIPQALQLDLLPGSSFTAAGRRVDVLGDIRAASGTIKLAAVQTPGLEGLSLPRAGVTVAGTLDTSGQWINDGQLAGGTPPQGVLAVNGGSIEISTTSANAEENPLLLLAPGAQLRANGGAWLDATGKLTPGKGGKIALLSLPEGEFNAGGDVKLEAFGVNGASGGGLRLAAGSIALTSAADWVSRATDPGAPLQLGASLFDAHGFSTFEITANGLRADSGSTDPVFRVESGTQLNVLTRSLELGADNSTRASSTSIDAFSSVVTLSEDRRPTTSVALRALPTATGTGENVGGMLIESGAVLTSGTRGSFALTSTGGIDVQGTLRAPGGSITLGVPNPDGKYDLGYRPDLKVALGSTAVLDVSGRAVLKPVDAGLQLGEVLGGGSINVVSDRGAVVIDSGAALLADGGSAYLDLVNPAVPGAYNRTLVGGAGGSITLQAPEAIVIGGQLHASAGATEGSRALPGGSLTVALTRDRGFATDLSLIDTYPAAPRVLRFGSDIATAAIPESGVALVDANQVRAGGFDSLRLEAGDRIDLVAGETFSVARQIQLDAPAIAVDGSGTVSLSAAYVSLGYAQPRDQAAIATGGSGRLEVTGDFVELIGSTSLQGIDSAQFTSRGDLRLRGTERDTSSVGALRIAGDLTLRSQRVYPSTGTEFLLQASGGASDTIRFEQNGPRSDVPLLSAAGKLRVEARRIEQLGTLQAPFGVIALAGSDEVVLGADSVTSVSGKDSLIPFGRVENGKSWVYSFGSVGVVAQTAIPDRQVSLESSSVTIAEGATVDLSGGGDLYAYEWIPGSGGTRDALSPAVNPGVYAVLPSLRDQYAPYDPQYSAGSSLTPGNSVYLDGVEGLPAGFYPLLPARYALLPGAFLVSAAPGFADIAPGTRGALSDGTTVVAGYRTFGTTGIGDSRYSGYAIRPGSYAHQLATYRDYLASTFFPARNERLDLPRAVIPADAGRLTIATRDFLAANGSVVTTPGTGGRGAAIEITAPQLTVVGGAADAASGGVQISADTLNSWHPASLLLGGRQSADGNSIEVSADSVLITDQAALAFDDLTLVANQAIELRNGASVASTSGQSGHSAVTGLPVTTIDLSGAGASGAAYLAVSDTRQALVRRPDSEGVTAAGSITIAADSRLSSRGALAIDAPGGALIDGTVSGEGARWALGAERLVFGGIGGGGPGEFAVSQTLLNAMGQGSAVRLTADSIDFASPIQLGAPATGSDVPSLGELTLVAAQVRNLNGNGEAAPGSTVLMARTLRIEGGAVATPEGEAAEAAGTLRLVGDDVFVGPGSLTTLGFAAVQIESSRLIRVQGDANLQVRGTLQMTASALTPDRDAEARIESSGLLQLNGNGTTPPALSSLQVGGALTLAADTVEVSGSILAPSGHVALLGTRSIALTGTGTVDASGTTVTAGGRSLGTPGGVLELRSGGDLALAAGSRLSVDGAGDAAAGRILLAANGNALIEATLSGRAANGVRGGAFDLQAQTLSDFAALNVQLQTGAFTERQVIHVAEGNLELSAAATARARQVEWIADAGNITVRGAISAPSGSQLSSVRLFAGGALSVESTGSIDAGSASATADGGSIVLGAGSAGTVRVAAGSRVSAGGASAGTLLVRAPQAGNDVAIGDLAGDFTGLREVVIEPVVMRTVSSAPDTAELTAAYEATRSYFESAAPGIRQRLNPTGTTPLVIRPGVELQHEGDLNLGALDLSGWRFDGEPANLTVRATGSLTITDTVSDGFRFDASGAVPRLELLAGSSAAIRLIAGASLNGADPLSVATAADPATRLALADAAVVRTGTGAIELRSAGDIVFDGPNAHVYTGGIEGAPTIAEFSDPAMTFATRGGAISLQAGRDIVGSPIAQSVSAWQTRRGTTDPGLPLSQWGTDYTQFGWTVGSLGGGGVSATAGRDVLNLAAAVADSGIANADGTLTTYGGGALTVAAGRDVDSGMFYVARGRGEITADRDFGSARESIDGLPVGTFLAVGDAQVALHARRDLLLETALNPQVLGQLDPGSAPRNYFFTYGENSGLSLDSVAGDITIAAQARRLSTFIGSNAVTLRTPANALTIFPGSLDVRAYSGDVAIGGRVILYPTDRGQLNVYAGRDVTGNSGGAGFLLSDAAADAIPGPFNPQAQASQVTTQIVRSAASARHAIADFEPVSVSAGRDISGLLLDLSKSARLSADRDIVNTTLNAQNLRAGDLTLLSAGRDFIFSDTATNGRVEVGGPGRLDIIAGRNVDLGLSVGVTTFGAVQNPQLSDKNGADITVMAGAGQTLGAAEFLPHVIAPSEAYRKQLVEFVAAQTGQQGLSFDAAATAFLTLDGATQRPFLLSVYFAELVTSGREANKFAQSGVDKFLTDVVVPNADYQALLVTYVESVTGKSGLSFDSARAEYRDFATKDQQPLFFIRGFNAIDTLFPGSQLTADSAATGPYAGDISLAFSRIYSVGGGNVSLLAPGGLVNVGLANPPADLGFTRGPSQLGIVAQKTGDVRIFSSGDVLVNQSRIFTLLGGDISIWSTTGDIDAGRGAKSAISAPPPRVVVDASGRVTLDFAGAVAGSGIRTILTQEGIEPGDVDLVAPFGIVDAGDAGIGSAGNITIAAQQVVGVDNINFGGSSSGVPADAGGLGAALSGVTGASSSAGAASNSGVGGDGGDKGGQPSLADAALGWLDVFVVGLGEENCRPDDNECLKRQQKP